jgi:PPOX class probable F420-dependent enzyme
VTAATSELSETGAAFLAERHLATLSTHGPSGLIHVVAVGFTLADGVVRVITSDGSQKVRNVERDPRATVAQVDGPRWLSIAGSAVVERDPAAVAMAEQLYAVRYRPPRVNPRRVVIRIVPERVLGSRALLVRG